MGNHEEFFLRLFRNPRAMQWSVKDSVKQSSIYARCAMEVLGISEPHIKTITELINITDLHVVDESNIYINPLVQGIFIDADNAILGSSPEEYLQYHNNIYAEYSHYGKEIYKAGRTVFLNDMLSREKIFNTDYMNNKYDKIAWNNMNNELYYLSTWEVK